MTSCWAGRGPGPQEPISDGWRSDRGPHFLEHICSSRARGNVPNWGTPLLNKNAKNTCLATLDKGILCERWFGGGENNVFRANECNRFVPGRSQWKERLMMLEVANIRGALTMYQVPGPARHWLCPLSTNGENGDSPLSSSFTKSGNRVSKGTSAWPRP